LNVEEVVKVVLESSDPGKATEEGLKKIPSKYLEKPMVVSVGKASIRMYQAFVHRVEPWKSIVVTTKGTINSKEVGADVIIEAGHPYPNEGSYKAGKTILEEVRKGGYSSFIFLLSGGSSSMMEWSDRLSLEEMIDLNRKLVKSGLSIDEVNTVRKHVSSIKGGRLGIEAKAPIFTLILSDVVGGDVSSVGSGPTVPDPTTSMDALDIMRSINIEEKFLNAVSETPKELPNSKAWIVLDIKGVLRQVKERIGGTILSSCVRGEARDFGYLLSSIFNASREGREPFKSPFTLIAGGEPEVKVEGESGKGGRNGEVCLSFAKYARGEYQLFAIATDGIDGNSEYAGCYVNSSMSFDTREISYSLRRHSSYELLERDGKKESSVIKTGPTGTNINNVYILYAP
jgi:glycerate 2-kinase